MTGEDKRAPIREEDFIASIADALQYIAVYHPPSFVKALAQAYAREESPAARDAIGQILINSRLSAFGRRPICQDTGTVNAFVKLGMGARIGSRRPLQDLVDEGVRDPLGERRNTGDNTPAVVHVEMIEGEAVTVAAKGGGSENKARYTNLAPAASVADWVISTVETLGARSATTEAFRGAADSQAISQKFGKSIDRSAVLFKTYNPVDPAQVRQADEARVRARRKRNKG